MKGWDVPELLDAHAGAKSWQDAADRYNAATGCRPPKTSMGIQLKCRSLGLAVHWPVVRRDSACEKALSDAVKSAVGWDQVAELYNAATGESRSMEALKSRAYALGLKLARKKKSGPQEGTGGRFDADGFEDRARRIRDYKERFGIRGRRMRPDEIKQALEHDQATWPEPDRAGVVDWSNSYRHPKVYRARLPRGRAS